MPAQGRPATPDELAALYLRDRDIDCPACGYNRRDGAAAACPECDHPLMLGGVLEGIDPTVADTALGTNCFVSGLLTIVTAIVLYQEARRFWDWSTDWIIGATGGAVVACGVVACSRAARAGRQTTRTVREIRISLRLLAIQVGLFIFLLLAAGVTS